MIFSKSLFFITLIMILTSCSDSKNDNPVKESPQKVSSQIGSFFDRKIDPQDDEYSKSIFTIKSAMMGTQGIAIYLGEHEGRKLFMTNKHVVDSTMDNCDDWISVVDVKSSMVLGCSGFIYSFENLDVSILSIDFISTINSSPGNQDIGKDSVQTTDFNDLKFKPLVLSSASLDSSSKLVLKTIDQDLKALVTDQGLDCVALDIQPRIITDPDPDTESPITSWSLPIGCDAKPGDSGAPVLNSEGQLVGVLWGGKLNKSFVDSNTLKNQMTLNSQNLWTDYNFMVPVASLIQELDLVLEAGGLSLEVQQSLSSLLRSTVSPIQK